MMIGSLSTRRWIVLIGLGAAIALGVLALVAIAQVDSAPAQGVTATGEVTTSQTEISGEVTTTEDVVPAGGTAAGDGGTAPDSRSLVPVFVGVAGLAMLGVAAGLARRRRFD